VRPLPIFPGDVYGRWTVISLDKSKPRRRWLCRCICGSESRIYPKALKGGETISCGCYGREARIAANTKHGHGRKGKKSKTFQVWMGMVNRCHSPQQEAYPHYGGRGITVCDAWRENFSTFLADMGEQPPGYSIERNDVNGNYEPGNCRWATTIEQRNNTRSNVMISVADDLMTMAEFARRHGFDYKRTSHRIRRGATEINGVKFELLGRRDSIRKEAA